MYFRLVFGQMDHVSVPYMQKTVQMKASEEEPGVWDSQSLFWVSVLIHKDDAVVMIATFNKLLRVCNVTLTSISTSL